MKIKDEEGKLGDYAELIKRMVGLRLEVRDLEQAIKEKKEEADTLFVGLKDLLKIEAVETDAGTYRWVKKAGGTTFNKDKCKDYLLKKGVDSDLVMEAFKAGTKAKKDSEYAAFFPPGEERADEKGA